jgi:mannose-6-phosphate isomerase-like protein (cupin superfamily)
MTVLIKSLLLVVLLISQTGPKVVPVGEEPRHHVVFQNKYVRVIDAAIVPGDTTLFHTHSVDNVPVVIAGGNLRTEILGGKITESSVETGSAWFVPATYTHRISNIGKTNLRFIDAEVLSSPPATPTATETDKVPGRTLVLENEQVRIYSLKLARGETTGFFTHSRPVLQVEVTGGNISVNQRGSIKKEMVVKPGEFHWSETTETRSITSIGDSPYEAVEIVWK